MYIWKDNILLSLVKAPASEPSFILLIRLSNFLSCDILSQIWILPHPSFHLKAMTNFPLEDVLLSGGTDKKYINVHYYKGESLYLIQDW